MRRRRAIERLLVLGVTLLVGSVAAAQDVKSTCQAPRFSVGRAITESSSLVALTISIRPEDFTRERLVCLAHALRARYNKTAAIDIAIFSSLDAARDYTVARGDEEPPVYRRYDRYSNMLRQLHATYVFSAVRSEEFLILKPLGNNFGGPYDTRIDLPTSEPGCDFQVKGRCLVALDHIEYPSEVLAAREAGTVVLTATIRRNGQVNGIRVATASGSTAAGRAMLIREARENLETWRFEAMPRIDTIQMTYSYVIDPAIPQQGIDVVVRLELPDRVVVTAGPLRVTSPR